MGNKKKNGSIRINELERLLGVPVIPISAAKNEGVNELVEHAIHVAKYQEKPIVNDFCDKETNNGAIHRAIHGIMELIEDHAKNAELPIFIVPSGITTFFIPTIDLLLTFDILNSLLSTNSTFCTIGSLVPVNFSPFAYAVLPTAISSAVAVASEVSMPVSTL